MPGPRPEQFRHRFDLEILIRQKEPQRRTRRPFLDHPAHDLDPVGLDRLTRPAAKPALPAPQLRVDSLQVQRETARKSF